FASGGFDLVGDFVAHAAVHFGDVGDGAGEEFFVPEFGGGGELFEIEGAAAVDFFEVPAGGVEVFEEGAFEGGDEVDGFGHFSFRCVPRMVRGANPTREAPLTDRFADRRGHDVGRKPRRHLL